MLSDPHASNAVHDRLLAAAKEGLPLNLTPADVLAVIDRWHDLIEAKNEVVRESYKPKGK